MSQTNNISLFVLLLLVLHTNTQLCPLINSNNIDLLQAGTALISNTNVNIPSKRQHQFTFTLNFNAPNGIQVAASASSFQVTAANGMDFSIWGGQGTTATTGMIILLINQDNSWSSIRVSYLASARSDFFLGSFSAAPYFAQRQSQSTFVTISEDLTSWVPSSKSFLVIVQLAGLKTSAINPVISLTAVSFNETTGTIFTTMALNATLLIQSVVITYVIADKLSPISYASFNAASGSTATYQFFGIDQIQSGSSIIAGNGFTSNASNGLTCIGTGCPSLCVTSQVCITYFGILTATNCFICAAGQIVSNGKCVSQSSPCSTNQYFNGTSCVCNNGYILVGSACYVSCGINAYVLNSQCQCIPGYMYSAVANQCIVQSSMCGANYVMINNQCICPSGFGILNNQCVVCPTNSFVDQNGNCACSAGLVFDNFTNTCTFCNTIGRAIVNGRCVCSPTFYPTNTTCVACISFSTYNATARVCICNQNFSLVNGNCVCNQNFSFINGNCVSNPTCPANSTLNNITLQCVCNTQGQFIINGICQTCQQNSAWNGSTCVCNPTFFNITGTCLQCDINSFYSNTLFTCICNNGYFGTFNNCTRCHSSCLTCTGATSLQCLTCPTNTNFSNGACISTCAAGTYLSSTNQCLPCDVSCASCSGPGNTLCTSCPSGFILQNGMCRNNSSPSNTTSRISLRGYVLGNQLIYQGVSMSLMPTVILSTGCSICNNLFLITANSKFSTITVTQQFLNNSQYWFIITFNFSDAASIPTFEYTIRINPIHANFFTLTDMAQLLTGSFNQQMFNQASILGGTTEANSVDVPPPMVGNSLNLTAPKNSGFNDKTIQQIFGTTRSPRN